MKLFKTIYTQLQQPAFKQMCTLLRSDAEVLRLDRNDAQWQGIENLLFDRLDAESAHNTFNIEHNKKHTSALFKPMLKPAMGVLSILIAALGIGFSAHFSGSPLENSAKLLSGGDVTVIAAQNKGNEQRALLRPGTVLKTGLDGILAVRIDAGSGLLLSPGSELRVVQANSRNIRFLLTRGAVHCTVSKRNHEQRFLVETPEALCTVVGTIFSVSIEPEGTRLSVHEGNVALRHLKNSDIHGMVAAGSSAVLGKGQLSGPQALAVNQTPVRELSLLSQATSAIGSDSGWLDVSTIPSGTALFIDGRPAGTTPLIMRASRGHHEVRLITGGIDTVLNITVTPARLSTAHLEMPSLNTPPRPSIDKNPKAADVCAIDSILPPSPAHIQALIQMTAGEYRAAITILDSLRHCPSVPFGERLTLIGDLAKCWHSIGDYSVKLAHLSEEISTGTSMRRENALWERAILKSVCLGDPKGAAADLKMYLHEYPKGAWRDEAVFRLAESYCLAGNVSAATNLLNDFVQNSRENSREMQAEGLYALANTLRLSGKGADAPIKIYTRLIKNHPESALIPLVLFERAELSLHLGRVEQARSDWRSCIACNSNLLTASVCERRLASTQTR